MLLSYELWVSLPMKLDTGEIKRKRIWVLPGVSWLSKHCHKKQNSLQTSSKIVRLCKKESLFPAMSQGYDGALGRLVIFACQGSPECTFLSTITTITSITITITTTNFITIIITTTATNTIPCPLPPSPPLSNHQLLSHLMKASFFKKNILKRTFYIKLSF